MGILKTADTMVDNSMQELANVLNSKFTSYLQGNGTPVLVTYYNLDTNNSTVELGSETYDKRLGDNSPLRFNKILDFPVYGLKDLIPTKEQLDGGLVDIDIEGDVVILPNSIKPNPLDHFVYHFLDGRSVTFRVTDIEYSSIKSNSYYKLTTSLADVNDDHTEDNLEDQTIKTYKTCLNILGTNERCIVEDTVFDTIESIDKIRKVMIQMYLDTFYERKYNALLFRGHSGGYPLFDPYLTNFIIKNNVLDKSSYGQYIVLVGYDMRQEVNRDYNKSIYRNLELRDTTHMKRLSIMPVTFRTIDTNPFAYYGEEVVFSVDLVEYIDPRHMVNAHGEGTPNSWCSNEYIHTDLLHRIENAQPFTDFPDDTSLKFGNIIINFLTKGNLYGLLTESSMKELLGYEVSYNWNDFVYVPMLIYILDEYIKYLRNNK